MRPSITARIPEALQIALRDLAPNACKLSDILAANPETSGIEYRASSMHTDFLSQCGFQTERGFCGFETSFLARWRRGTGWPVVTLLAEYDALPVIGHGCGHNLGGAMSSLAAAALALWGKIENVEIRVLGTPSEEEGDAKVLMADRGVFNDTDMALMIHPAPGFSTASFRSTACSVREICFQDPVSGSSFPENEKTMPAGALEAFCKAMFSCHEDGWPSAVASPLGCHEDDVPSSAPRSAKECFAFYSARRSFLQKFLEKARHEAAEIGERCGLDVSWTSRGADLAEYLRNEAAERYMEEIFRSLHVAIDESPRIHGSGDIGNVSHVCPTLHALLDATGGKIPWHSREFVQATTERKAHEAIHVGATALTSFIIDFIHLRPLREAITAAHDSARLDSAS